MNNMADECSQAISFMNSYFSLIDGLASGLENHLAENVILDWFGKTVRGKKNVSAFIRKNKVDSRHMFASIKPTDGISYKKNCSNRKQGLSDFEEKSNRHEETKVANLNCEISNTILHEYKINWKKVPEEEEDDMAYILDEGDLCNLFQCHMNRSDVEEIEERVNRMKLEEKTTPMIGIVKGEYVQEEDGSNLDQKRCQIKYVEAVGQIIFSRKYWKKGIYSRYNIVPLKNHDWHHPCKLQIAYTILKEQQASISSMDSSQSFRSSVERKLLPKQHKKLPSLEEITSLSNRLVPNVNDFGGYLTTFDFYRDRESFLMRLKNELSINEGTSFLTGCARHKPIFNRPTTNLSYGDSNNNENTKESVNFVFNYQIHVIIYESVYKSRRNPHRARFAVASKVHRRAK